MGAQPLNIYSLLSVRRLYSIYHTVFSKGFSYSGESHDFWEMSFVIKGHMGNTSGDDIYICNEGEAVLIAPNVFHSMWTDTDEHCEAFTVSFNGVGLERRLPPGKYLMTESEKMSFMQIINEASDLFINEDENGVHRLINTTSLDNVGYQVVKNHLELILVSIIRRGKKARQIPSDDPRSLCYAKITEFLRDNVDKNLTIDEISHGVYESTGKIKEIFRLFTGGGVIQYFNYLRCEHIMQRLKHGDSVKDIAASMNFSSPYYLSYFFKRETGMTAREYLKSIDKTLES